MGHVKIQGQLQETIELYLTECEIIKRLRPATINGYRELFFTFLNAMPEIEKVNDIQPVSINLFFKRISDRKEGGVKGSTVRTYYDKLMVFFRWLESYSYLPKGTLVGKVMKPPQPQYNDIKALSNDQINKIISTISIQGIQNTFQYRRDMVIIQLFIYTGIRKGELLGLRVSDIDWAKQMLFISGETSKSKRNRTIPLNFVLLQSLKAYISELKHLHVATERLIVAQRTYSPLTENGLKHWVSKYNRLSGIRFHLHQFRHSFACALAKSHTDIISIKTLLGHTNSTMTERYLRSITAESTRDSIDRLSY